MINCTQAFHAPGPPHAGGGHDKITRAELDSYLLHKKAEVAFPSRHHGTLSNPLEEGDLHRLTVASGQKLGKIRKALPSIYYLRMHEPMLSNSKEYSISRACFGKEAEGKRRGRVAHK